MATTPSVACMWSWAPGEDDGRGRAKTLRCADVKAPDLASLHLHLCALPRRPQRSTPAGATRAVAPSQTYHRARGGCKTCSSTTSHNFPQPPTTSHLHLDTHPRTAHQPTASATTSSPRCSQSRRSIHYSAFHQPASRRRPSGARRRPPPVERATLAAHYSASYAIRELGCRALML